jgi:two-component system, LytTR family, response regulator
MTAVPLTILAVDDEHTQLEDLARMLRSSPAVEEVECAFDARDALAKVSSQRYDAIFLDVRMPDIDGVELARVLRRFAAPPQLVFVSAYDSAAVEAFELRALDYLRKPVSRRRVEEALERIAIAIDARDAGIQNDHSRAEATEGDRLAVANIRGGSTRLVSRGSILYVQSQGDFVRIVTEDGGRYLLRATLREVECRWERFGFVRVHRQYLVNLGKAVELRPLFGGTAQLEFADGRTIPVARRHVPELGRRLGV